MTHDSKLGACAASIGIRDAASTLRRLADEASLEMSVHDIRELEASQELLAPSTRMYVSHLPGQAWEATVAACTAAKRAGCLPIPHVPVRCIKDRLSFERFLAECVRIANVAEVLLIAGDYSSSVGPFDTTMSVLESGLLEKHGIRRLSVAGHPEGHPKASDVELRSAEREKISFAYDRGMPLTFLTQFFFDAAPFIEWRRQLQIDDSRVRVVAGLAGPAKLSTLFRFAVKCGVGASIRALGARPATFSQLLGERGPESIVLELARNNSEQASGIHLFSFGGLMRTCAWLAAVRAGRFKLDDNVGLLVRDRE
jgi:methylenetetrahydrofolate reductase (NADPH)